MDDLGYGAPHWHHYVRECAGDADADSKAKGRSRARILAAVSEDASSSGDGATSGAEEAKQEGSSESEASTDASERDAQAESQEDERLQLRKFDGSESPGGRDDAAPHEQLSEDAREALSKRPNFAHSCSRLYLDNALHQTSYSHQICMAEARH